MNKNNTVYRGVGLLDLLLVLFIFLKLTKVINWSWWWVLCPFWIQFVIMVAVVLVVVIIGAVANGQKK